MAPNPEQHFVTPPNRPVFNALVWEIARQIPPGKVCSYGKLASLIPPPPGMSYKDYQAWGARWVGGAMAACPADVPWQRVLNAQGKISLRGGGGGNEQRRLLEEEGVIFDEHERVDLSRYGWTGPEQAWLAAHGLLQDDAQAGG